MSTHLAEPEARASTERESHWSAIVILLAVSFLLTWLVWGSVIGNERGVLPFHIPQGLALWMLLIAVGVVAPSTGGRAAMRDLISRLLRWQVHWVWYLIAVAVPVVLSAGAVVVSNLMGNDVPTGVDEPLGAALGYFAFGILLFALTEELAWRGFVLPRLQARLTPIWAALVLGAIWAVWHTPLFFIADSSQRGWPYVGFVILVLAESVLISWVFNHSRGSVLLAAVFHASSDASLAFSGALSGTDTTFWVVVFVYTIAAVALTAARRSEWTGSLSRFPEAIYPSP